MFTNVLKLSKRRMAQVAGGEFSRQASRGTAGFLSLFPEQSRSSEPFAMEELESRTFLSAAPVAPAVATSFLPMTNQAQISWNKPSGASTFTLYRNTVNNSTSASILASGTSSTSYTDKLDVGKTYYYWVKAFNGSLGTLSSASQCTDTDRSISKTVSVSGDKLIAALNFVNDLKSDLDTITSLAFGLSPSVSFRLSSLGGSITESEIVTSSGTIVSGTASGSINEAGSVTAQVSAGIPHIASVAVGLEVDETLSLGVYASYSASSSGWVFGSGSSLSGTVSATGFGQGTLLGFTGQVNVTSPTASWSLNLGTTGAQGSVGVSGPVTVGYSVTGPLKYSASGTIYKSPSVHLPTWSFSIANIKGLL